MSFAGNASRERTGLNDQAFSTYLSSIRSLLYRTMQRNNKQLSIDCVQRIDRLRTAIRRPLIGQSRRSRHDHVVAFGLRVEVSIAITISGHIVYAGNGLGS